MQSRVMVLWCPDWPAVAALQHSGMAADLPAMVLMSGRVQVATAAARAYGIRAGMRKRDAVSRCPEIAILGSDPDRDARLFEPIAAAAEEITPGIEVLRPGLIACGARGPARYFGSENAAAERIVDAVEAFDVECRVGIAGGLSTAILAARRRAIVPVSTARDAAARDAEFCAGLSLVELARDPALAPPQWRELIDLLQRLGITTAGALAALPMQKVATRFGADGVALHRLASGTAERDVSRRRIETDISVEERYDPPLERVDTAAFAARALALRFHTRLAAAGLACTRLDITAATEHGETLTRTWRCIRPLDAAATADRLRWQLDGWLAAAARVGRTATTGKTPRAGTITMLRLDAVEAVDAGRIQYGLWGADGFSEHRAGSAFVRVQGLLGTAAVVAPTRSGGRGAADRIAVTAWGDIGAPDRDPAGPWPGALPVPAPPSIASACLTVPAQPADGRIDVCDPAGYRVDVTHRGMLTGHPSSVGGRRVLSWAGPWLLDERWSSSIPQQRRARMQVVTESGPPVLLELDADGWLVEAVYD